MKHIILILFNVVFVGAIFAQSEAALISQAQARDLRKLLAAVPEIPRGHFLLDTTRLNASNTKSEAHGKFHLATPQSLATVLTAYRVKYPKNIYLSKQSSVVIFSARSVVRYDLYIVSESDLEGIMVAEGDVVLVGNYGDYL